jgi:hypothetical protein
MAQAEVRAWPRGHHGRVTTGVALDLGDEHGRATWQASCSCGWRPAPHTRGERAHRAMRHHVAAVLADGAVPGGR